MIWNLIVIIKFGFFEIFNPPISSESRTSPIFTIEVAPNGLNVFIFFKDIMKTTCFNMNALEVFLQKMLSLLLLTVYMMKIGGNIEIVPSSKPNQIVY